MPVEKEWESGVGQDKVGMVQTKEGCTHLLAPGLIVGTQEQKAGTGHWAQGIPHIRSGQKLQGLLQKWLNQ